MDHTLINTIVASICTAFVFGLVAKQLKLPTILGYLLAGIAIGPHTPGYVGDVALAKQLAEIGIILLMFGVGLHFSLRDLQKVRGIAFPGAILQMVATTILATIAARLIGYTTVEGLIYGISLSVASTIVLLRAFEPRKTLETHGGKVAVGWLVIEDIAMVLVLVMLPSLAGMAGDHGTLQLSVIATALLVVILKIGAFVVLMLVVGRRFLPWLLTHIERMKSSELNTLGTLAIALGFAALAYTVFGASLALGAFLAGMVLNESEIGHHSAENSLPMRDAFSVLFFVSVGMLFEPSTLILHPVAVIMTFAIIVLLKGGLALLIMRLFKQTREAGWMVALGLAQIGEFSFILGSLALDHELITQDLYNLILAGAMLSIVVNPLLFSLYDKVAKRRVIALL